MTSSKTTVLGIRLDHERRAWIEAEAARQGVSIRAYFESMIDEARLASHDPVESREPIGRGHVLGVESETRGDTAAVVTSGAWSTGGAGRMPESPFGVSTESPPGLCDDLVSMVTISGRVLKEVMGLPGALVNVATRPFRRHHVG
jgi:hypothetical protein